MARKKTVKLLAKLVIVSAIMATLPLVTGANIHADGIGIQRAVKTAMRQTTNHVTNSIKKDNKTAHQAPEPEADSGFYECYGGGAVMVNGKVTPYGQFINALMFLGLVSLAGSLVVTIKFSFQTLCPNKTTKAPIEERRNSYEVR